MGYTAVVDMLHCDVWSDGHIDAVNVNMAYTVLIIYAVMTYSVVVAYDAMTYTVVVAYAVMTYIVLVAYAFMA